MERRKGINSGMVPILERCHPCDVLYILWRPLSTWYIELEKRTRDNDETSLNWLKPIYLSVWSQFISVFVKLHSVLSCLRPTNLANLTICGDFNIDASVSLSPLSNTLNDFHLSQVVSEPTRVTPSSATVIDLVLMSNTSLQSSCVVGVPLANSDHWTISLNLKIPYYSWKKNTLTRTIWIYKKANTELGKSLLKDLLVASDCDINTFGISGPAVSCHPWKWDDQPAHARIRSHRLSDVFQAKWNRVWVRSEGREGDWRWAYACKSRE